MKSKTIKDVQHLSSPNGCLPNCPACENPARDQAKTQLESITKMVLELKVSKKLDAIASSPERFEEAEQTIHDDPLSVEIRDDWYSPGDPDTQRLAEYRILLCWGGPACRIIGKLNGTEPETARLEYQDWGTPWAEFRVTSEQEEILLTYARCFYYGE